MTTLNSIKFIQWFVLTNIILFGCKANKDKSTAIRMQQQIEGRVNSTTSYQNWANTDSTSRFWRYTTDSSFLFHPNLGLSGQSGRLEYLERNIVGMKADLERVTYDSTGAAYSEEINNTSTSQTKYVWGRMVYLLAIVSILIGIYKFWRKTN
ncbi:hypothetical protein [Sphingobacterium paucimobilis]|uniref:Uncharacterized protein n=1 Tax=Sphingobacterium paucimobilis HER1398 TaxID=1346330 RepID=U2HVG1_9SPHI|nr:hypothetical protein [Sphingobacterium paucimobilis]ERJ59265.1 hypothetical protein M472_10815 [Sphingobacterium paucimobilis HER1398]